MGGRGFNMKRDAIVSEPLSEFHNLSPRQNGEENKPHSGRCKLIHDKLSAECLWVAAVVLSVEVGMTGTDR